MSTKQNTSKVEETPEVFYMREGDVENAINRECQVGFTTKETIHGNPGERRVLPKGIKVRAIHAYNLPETSEIKYWVYPLPNFEFLWPQATLDWCESVGVGLTSSEIDFSEE